MREMTIYRTVDPSAAEIIESQVPLEAVTRRKGHGPTEIVAAMQDRFGGDPIRTEPKVINDVIIWFGPYTDCKGPVSLVVIPSPQEHMTQDEDAEEYLAELEARCRRIANDLAG